MILHPSEMTLGSAIAPVCRPTDGSARGALRAIAHNAGRCCAVRHQDDVVLDDGCQSFAHVFSSQGGQGRAGPAWASGGLLLRMRLILLHLYTRSVGSLHGHHHPMMIKLSPRGSSHDIFRRRLRCAGRLPASFLSPQKVPAETDSARALAPSSRLAHRNPEAQTGNSALFRTIFRSVFMAQSEV